MTSPSVALMREADALKAAGRLGEAIERYAAAANANPASAVAEHNLAAALGDAGRWPEAATHLERAFGKGLDAPETWLVLARCRQALRDYDGAASAFREAIKRRATLYDAHRELAQLAWMRSGDVEAAVSDLERAMREAPGDARLRLIYAEGLTFGGRSDQALASLAELAAGASREDPRVLHAAAEAALNVVPAQASLALRFAERAVALDPKAFAPKVRLAEACIAVGDAVRAEGLARSLCAERPDNQHAIALQATAWRILGDPRYRSLYDYESFVATAFLDVPPGWRDLDAYVKDVASALRSAHSYRAHPFNQSLRQGRQAVDILQQPHPALRALPKALDGPIRRRLKALGSGSDPLRARNQGGYAIKGMWSVELHAGGYHVDHVHPDGWISSACYLELPNGEGHEGWIRFGAAPIPSPTPLPAEHFVKPAPGMLALFPSYMWHGTVPFRGDQRRLTFAFDLVPAPA